MSAPRICRFHAEHRSDAFGIGTAAPRLSWWTETDIPGWTQGAYEVQVAAPDGTEHSSGIVQSAESVLVAWPAAVLRSREVCTVRVRVVGSDGSESQWSDPLTVEAALLAADDLVLAAPAHPFDPLAANATNGVRFRRGRDGVLRAREPTFRFT